MWEALKEGRNTHGPIPATRWNSTSFHHPITEHPGTINANGGYFLQEDPRLFDNSFFGINNLEARYMDPQQRKLLEVVFECFENAGMPIEEVSGANVGSYIANFTADFGIMQTKDPETFHRYTATGLGSTILASRVSHVFNLKGPSMVLDTACSSSLYSLHAACSALKARDCEAAIVAGANLILSPEIYIGAVKLGTLSPRSVCNTFDIAADGYGRAEGVGALLLKRLTDARRCGDHIRAVIRATSANR